MPPESLPRVLLFFGAGASAWAGYRTFLSFPALFWPAGTQPSELEATDREKQLLDDLRLHIATRRMPPTLDTYLSLIRGYHLATSNLVSDTVLRERLLNTSLQWASVQDLRNLLLSVRDRITKLTAGHYRMSPRAEEELTDLVYEFYEIVASADEAHRVQLFTTNYDLVPEYLFSTQTAFAGWRRGRRPRLDLANGFHGVEGQASQPTDTAIPPVSSSQRPRWMGVAPNTNYPTLSCYRLHGCVAWLHGDFGDDQVYFDLSGPTTIPGFADKLCVSYPGHEQLYGRDPHREAFTALAIAAQSADVMLFVGYSFRDPEVAAVVGGALHAASRVDGRPCARFLVVDPQITRGEVVARLRQATTESAGACVNWDQLAIDVVRSSFPSPEVNEAVRRELSRE